MSSQALIRKTGQLSMQCNAVKSAPCPVERQRRSSINSLRSFLSHPLPSLLLNPRYQLRLPHNTREKKMGQELLNSHPKGNVTAFPNTCVSAETSLCSDGSEQISSIKACLDRLHMLSLSPACPPKETFVASLC